MSKNKEIIDQTIAVLEVRLGMNQGLLRWEKGKESPDLEWVECLEVENEEYNTLLVGLKQI